MNWQDVENSMIRQGIWQGPCVACGQRGTVPDYRAEHDHYVWWCSAHSEQAECPAPLAETLRLT